MWVVAHAQELDGKLVPQARLLDLPIRGMLNFAFANILDGLEPKQRAYVIASLEGRIGPGGGIIESDPDSPNYGKEAPSWWNDSPEDPFSDTFTVG